MARDAASLVARRHKRVSQAGFPDRAEVVASTDQRSQGLIYCLKRIMKPAFLTVLSRGVLLQWVL